METFTPDQKLLALSWKQPFTELMLHGKIETRTWPTHYRGWVLICASKVPYHIEQINDIAGNIQYERIWQTVRIGKSLCGHAIAIGRLVNCRQMTKSDEDRCFVEYHPDLWCYVYEDVQAIIPIPWKGTQGWKEVSVEIKQQITILTI